MDISFEQAADRLSQLFGEGNGFFYRCDCALQRVMYVGSSFERVTGYSSSDLIGGQMLLTTLIHPDSRQSFLDTAVAALDNKVSDGVARIQCADGESKYLRFLNNVVLEGEEEADCAVIGFALDITADYRAARSLKRTQRRLDTAQAVGGIGGWEYYPATGEVTWSSNLFRLLDLDPAKGVPDLTEHPRFFTEESAARVTEALAHTAATGAPYEVILERVRSNGEIRYFFAKGRAQQDNRGIVTRVSGSLLDITEQKRIENDLRASQSRYFSLFNNALLSIAVFDVHGAGEKFTFKDVNEAALTVAGLDRDTLMAMSPEEMLPAVGGRELLDGMRRVWLSGVSERRTYIVHDTGRSERWYDSQMFRLNTGELVTLFDDITKSKRIEQELERLAYADALTGVANRTLFEDRLRQAMPQAVRRHQNLVVAYLDLDGFKAVNDNYGHDVGDQLLIKIAERLQRALRDGDTLARIGGDEFVALLVDVAPGEAATHMLDRILKAVATPVSIDGEAHVVSTSLGATLYPQNGVVSLNQVLKQADQAMYQAKLAGKNCYRWFDADADDTSGDGAS